MGARLQGELTTLRPAAAADAELLARWHADPEVARFWDGETYGVDEIRERLSRRDVDSWLVEERGRPVGYLQVWRGGPGERGLDMFLEPAARGRGLGPDAARTAARSLVAAGWTRVTVDPYAWNESAIRAWQRAGFVAVESRPADGEHRHAWVLMEFREAPRRREPDAGSVGARR